MDIRFLHQISYDDLVSWLQEHHEPAFRAKQIFDWIFTHAALSYDTMTNVSVSLRKQLAESFSITPLICIGKERSDDGETTKYLWKLHDNHCVESVLIKAPGRVTVCVSSQVGCPVRCAFCASGKEGHVRNLNTAEIVAQVLCIQNEAPQDKITHVVFMGMGEPLQNYEAVVAAIRCLVDPKRVGMSQRRITLSTVGVIEGIKALSKEGLGINLAFSLHAPNQEIRKKIIPYARQYALADILQALDEYRESTGRDITYEYILLGGINDREEDANALVQLLKGKPCSVNLIPYNPVSGLTLKRPSTEAITAFRDALIRANIVTTCRFTKGRDIAAACGQLALRSREDRCV